MGYQPSIDSYEETLGSWTRRREVLAWSAGTRIVMRAKETDVKDTDDLKDTTRSLDTFRHLSTWYTYKIPESQEGRDDITNLRLLRPYQKEQGFESMVFGTASGLLARLDVDPQQAQTIEQSFDTLDRAVGALAVSSGNTPLLATSLGDTSLSLFPLDCELSERPIEAVSDVMPTIQGARTGRIWSCNFLSEDKVAIGIGPTSEPIQVYKITADGFLAEPYRTFSLGTTRSTQTSIYPILPITGRTQGGSEAGNVFLSGGYDGIVRLHDLRSPRDVESLYWDPTNDSSIYSLASQGLERVVVGVSMHSMLKVFDLRLAGSNTYSGIAIPSKTKTKAKSRYPDNTTNSIVTDTPAPTASIWGGWNLFLNPRTPPKRSAYREDFTRGRDDSPVYSISVPSPTSPHLYAGLEGAIEALTFHGIADTHPDTLLSNSATLLPDNKAVDVTTSYNPRGDALNLGMYEQGDEEGLGMQLLVQDEVSTEAAQAGLKRVEEKYKGLDERWKDLRDEKDRWTRGVPQGPRHGNRGGRGGRGRGRGRGRARGV